MRLLWVFYRPLMRLAHRFNWHHTQTYYPEGDTLVICTWCGLRQVTRRQRAEECYEPIKARTDRTGQLP